MIVVTGTKRSGTSMWMQILVGAGFPFIGERFPARWKDSIQAANPEGFFESRLRRGVFGRNDLDPLTGKPLDVHEYSHHAVKIFVPGVVRTDKRHLGHVIASMRDFREYEDSRRRMWQMEDEARQERMPGALPPARLEPVYEWWTSNYVLLVDALRRGYSLKLCAYDTMLEHPERTIRETLLWLGRGDSTGALSAVKPEHRTQRARPMPRAVEPAVVEVFDELYDLVRRQQPLNRALVSKLETVNRTLLPRLKADLAQVRAQRSARRASLAQPTADDAQAAEQSHDDGSELALLPGALVEKPEKP